MSEQERKDQSGWASTQRWSAWDSPVGLGLFFVLLATAADLIRLAFK